MMAMRAASVLANRLSSTARSALAFSPSRCESFFKYTDGRWLYNEDHQCSSRYVKFDVTELQLTACAAVGAQSCVEFNKLAEGSYNKVFSMRFNNGSEAIARLPTKLAGPAFFTTASEVATLDFARTVLGIPAPRVFAWSAHADRNPVGSEYIIMEKAPGVELVRRWFDNDFSGPAVKALMHGVYEMENAFECAPFSQIGSLYYTEDVSTELQHHPLFLLDRLPHDKPEQLAKLTAANAKYRIGPIADRQWWRGERAEMSADRGPWPSMSSFLLAAVELERAWIVQHAAHQNSAYHRRYPSSNANAHLRLLDMCSQAIPYICPPADLLAPTLWHPDISLTNLRVPETGHANLVGVLDWQHALIAPYCMQAHFPSMFVYRGDRIMVLPGPFLPKLPDHVSSLSPEEQELYRLDLKLAFRQKLYEVFIEKNALRSRACDFGASLTMLPWHILRSWADGLVPLRETLIDLQHNWGLLAHNGDLPCPIQFTEEEIREHEMELGRHTAYQQSIDTLNDFLGCGGDGVVSQSGHAAAMDRLVVSKNEWDEKQSGGPFPYNDGMFSFFLN